MGPRRLVPSLKAPSTSLPPLLKLHLYQASDISQALQNLRDLYFSPFLASKQDKIVLLMHHHRVVADTTQVPDSGYASAEEDGDEEDAQGANTDIDTLRADSMERAFAVRWLTGFLSRGHAWAARDDVDDAAARADMLDDVSSLLSLFSAISEQDSTAVTRTFRFVGPGGGVVCVKLNDEPLSMEDHTSVGLQSWASSVILAERMCTSPGTFGLAGDRPLRVLELGAGTGLLSIVASKLLTSGGSSSSASKSTVVASDFHPDVLANCTTNVKLNASGCQSRVLVRRLDWEKPSYDDGVFEEPFDVVLAADVIYHVEHAWWIKGVVERVLAKPSSCHEKSGPRHFWLLIPTRTTGRHEGLDQTVDSVFGEDSAGLVIIEQEEIAREKAVGRADESGYRLFKIGWTL